MKTTYETIVIADGNHASIEIPDKKLHGIISANLPLADSKVWHAHPVWFIEPGLKPTGTFKAAEIVFTDAGRIDEAELQRYLKKAVRIQWDYKNIIKNKGLLELKK
ncbi:MAG TPA: hypothetical protein VF572_04365 [Candidatus Saccharimonadales bacterium]|jgi:hypothetical protein